MKILVTGSDGFIGKNLIFKLYEAKEHQVLTFVRGDPLDRLTHSLSVADVVIHLAAENRPPSEDLFESVNVGLTTTICEILKSNKSKASVILSSSQQALKNNPYGQSKLASEKVVKSLATDNGNQVFIYRLPGVFGKWCKPNYNSVVATFCNNIAKDLPIKIDYPDSKVRLVYVDDVVKSFLWAIDQLQSKNTIEVEVEVSPQFEIKLIDLAAQIKAFRASRISLISERVGDGLTRALYGTYLSYLPPEMFSYDIPLHSDERGGFVEMLKTQDSGQISFFTAHPGVTRGGHYHHTKSEKFLVIKGMARFRFRHMITDEKISLDTSGEFPKIVETVPGWAHNITNIGDEDMFVMLWANEIFDRDNPDTFSGEI